MQHHCPDLHAWWLRPHEAALRARAHDRCADAQRSPDQHAHALRPRPARSRLARRPQSQRYCIACNVQTCELALCVQALRVLAPCVRVQRAGTGISTRAAPALLRARALREDHIAAMLLCFLRCARSCPVRASAARACALHAGAQCLGRYWPRCISTSRYCSSCMDYEVAQLPIIAQLSFVVVISHRL